MRRLIATHEAGHAAVSLALGQGHQLGVSIVPSEDAIGSHAVGDQYDLTGLPAFLAVREAIKRAIVGLGGPIAERGCSGEPFVLDTFLREGGPDAEGFKEYVDVISQHAQVGDLGWLVDAAVDLVRRPDVAGLIDAIASALARRGKLSGEMLGRIHDEHPTDPELIRVPTTLARTLLAAASQDIGA